MNPAYGLTLTHVAEVVGLDQLGCSHNLYIFLTAIVTSGACQGFAPNTRLSRRRLRRLVLERLDDVH
jgi:hypothetical protein